jgi:predicted nucleic acid-binding protein
VTRYVIDASVAVEYLLRTPLGLAAAGILDNASLVAPELMDAEVLSVLRRAVLNGRLGNITGTSVPMMPFTWPPPAPTAYH